MEKLYRRPFDRDGQKASKGMPNTVIELGEKFGRLMNYGDGMYAGQFMGAMYAEAFFEASVERIIAAGLSAIPPPPFYESQLKSGSCSLKNELIASTNNGYDGNDLIWQVCLNDIIRSTHRLPFSFCVPLLLFLHKTPKRIVLSARLFVGTTPATSIKTHRESICLINDFANVPVSPVSFL